MTVRVVSGYNQLTFIDPRVLLEDDRKSISKKLRQRLSAMRIKEVMSRIIETVKNALDCYFFSAFRAAIFLTIAFCFWKKILRIAT